MNERSDQTTASGRRTPQQITSIVYRHWLGQVGEFPELRNDLKQKWSHFVLDRRHVEETNNAKT